MSYSPAPASLASCRLHGDFHPGNILWRAEGPHIVDLDDCCNGPAIQDLWMLLSGSRESMRAQLALLVEGYSQFALLDRAELLLIEPLRTLRMIHHSAWLAERWSDPAFPAGVSVVRQSELLAAADPAAARAARRDGASRRCS